MRSLNLLPWRDRRQRTRRREACTALLCGLVGGVGFLTAAELHLAGRLKETERRASQVETALADHRAAAAAQRELEARKADMGALLAELERVSGHNRSVQDWLEQLPEALPPESRLKRLEIRDGAWELHGEARNLEAVARLLEAVRAMPMVSEARIEHVRGDPVQARDFALTGGFGK